MDFEANPKGKCHNYHVRSGTLIVATPNRASGLGSDVRVHATARKRDRGIFLKLNIRPFFISCQHCLNFLLTSLLSLISISSRIISRQYRLNFLPIPLPVLIATSSTTCKMPGLTAAEITRITSLAVTAILTIIGWFATSKFVFITSN